MFYSEISIGAFIFNFGSGALSGKMLLVMIVENNKNDTYSRAV